MLFQFTRHATSCNNENAGKGIFGKDYEPSLTARGIEESIKLREKKYNNSDLDKRFEADRVYVSCLLRTWCTAVLLYGNSNKDLTIIISPYLKEAHKNVSIIRINRGNAPKLTNHMLSKFLKFLNYIAKSFTGTNREKYLPKKINFYIKYNKNNEQNYSNNVKYEFIIDKSKGKTSVSIVYIDPPKNDVYFVGNHSKYSLIDSCNKFGDIIMDEKNKTGYQNTGNLNSFMNWFNNDKKSKIMKNERIIHVVTHSNIMRKYLENISAPKEDIYRIKNENCSSILVINDNTYQIYDGYKKLSDKKKGENKNVLCGIIGSVNKEVDYIEDCPKPKSKKSSTRKKISNKVLKLLTRRKKKGSKR